MAKKELIALFTNNDDDIYCFRLELIKAIIDAGYDLLISCPDGPKFSVLEKENLIKNKNFIYDNPHIDRRGTNPISDSRLIFHYLKLLRKYRPSVLLTYTPKPNVYATMVAHRLNIPVISNVTGLGSVEKHNGFRKVLIMAMFKYAYNKSACIMFQNNYNLLLAKEKGWIKNDYRLIPGSGVALNRFSVLYYPDGGNGIEGETVVFNYIGRILHDKGVDDYINAAKRIKAKFPNTEFNLIGFIEPTEIHYENDLELLQKQDIVYYRGSQDDIRPWIKRSHCTIHPSIYGEGMSNVLLESAACGRPIITTDNHGCQETVDDDISGFIYRGGDVDALVKKIEMFLNEKTNDERRTMGLNGRKKVECEFNREIVVNAYTEKIEELLI